MHLVVKIRWVRRWCVWWADGCSMSLGLSVWNGKEVVKGYPIGSGLCSWEGRRGESRGRRRCCQGSYGRSWNWTERTQRSIVRLRGKRGHCGDGGVQAAVQCDVFPTSEGLLRLDSVDESSWEDDELDWLGVSASGQDSRVHSAHGQSGRRVGNVRETVIVIACTASSILSHLHGMPI